MGGLEYSSKNSFINVKKMILEQCRCVNEIFAMAVICVISIMIHSTVYSVTTFSIRPYSFLMFLFSGFLLTLNDLLSSRFVNVE